MVEYYQGHGNEAAGAIVGHLTAAINEAKGRAEDWKEWGNVLGMFLGTGVSIWTLVATQGGIPAEVQRAIAEGTMSSLDFYKANPSLYLPQLASYSLTMLGGYMGGGKLGEYLARDKTNRVAEELIARFSPKQEPEQTQP